MWSLDRYRQNAQQPFGCTHEIRWGRRYCCICVPVVVYSYGTTLLFVRRHQISHESERKVIYTNMHVELYLYTVLSAGHESQQYRFIDQ